MGNWQPISTAPKDRRILLAYDNGFVKSAKIMNEYTILHRKYPIAWQELPVFDGVIDGK